MSVPKPCRSPKSSVGLTVGHAVARLCVFVCVFLRVDRLLVHQRDLLGRPREGGGISVYGPDVYRDVGAGCWLEGPGLGVRRGSVFFGKWKEEGDAERGE